MALSAIRKGTTRKIRLTILYNGAAIDISGDTVNFMLKATKTALDSAALVNTNADVAAEGASGIATITLSSTNTNQTVGKKYYEILWTRSNGEVYVLDSDEVQIIARLTGITS
jgi:hypothetical protein